jgi:integrase/recombinase XerD
MVYRFERVSAVVGMNVEDYYQQGKRWWIRLHVKGGKHHEVPAHHKAEEYLDAFITAAGIGKGRRHRVDVYRMIQRRIGQAELNARASCHTYRATGITAYLLTTAARSRTRKQSRRIKAHARQSCMTGRPIK